MWTPSSGYWNVSLQGLYLFPPHLVWKRLRFRKPKGRSQTFRTVEGHRKADALRLSNINPRARTLPGALHRRLTLHFRLVSPSVSNSKWMVFTQVQWPPALRSRTPLCLHRKSAKQHFSIYVFVLSPTSNVPAANFMLQKQKNYFLKQKRQDVRNNR